MGAGWSAEKMEKIAKSMEDEVFFEQFTKENDILSAKYNPFLLIGAMHYDVHPIVASRLLEAGVGVTKAVWVNIDEYSWQGNNTNFVEKAKLLLKYGNGYDYLPDIIYKPNGIRVVNSIIASLMIENGSSPNHLLPLAKHVINHIHRCDGRNFSRDKDTYYGNCKFKQYFDTWSYLFEIFVRRGANVHARDDTTNMSVVEYIFSAAHQCITHGQSNGANRLDTISDGVLRIIQVLIDAGAVVNNDVLFHCRSTKTLKFAINNCRCDVNHRNFYGRPVLTYYARALFDVKPSDDENGRIVNCYMDMINILLQKGADLAIKDNDGLDVIQVVRSFVDRKNSVLVKRWEKLNAKFLEYNYRRHPEAPVAQAPIVTKTPVEMPVVPAPAAAPVTATVMYRSETCITCNEKQPEMWFNTSCGHMCVCAECFARLPSSSTGMRSCPVCRVEVSSYVEVKNT